MIERIVSTVRTRPGVMVAELTEYCNPNIGAVVGWISIGGWIGEEGGRGKGRMDERLRTAVLSADCGADSLIGDLVL